VDSSPFFGPRRVPAFADERRNMVRLQIEARGVKAPEVLEAMREAPRHLFVPAHLISQVHDDNPLPIGQGQTISQPYIVARMTELAEISPLARVLEVGTGSGYQTWILARLARQVCTVEIVADLQARARRQLEELGVSNVLYRVGDGWDGWPEQAPFDAIVVTAAPDTVPPALREQMTDGGRLVIPVGPEGCQELMRIHRRGDSFDERSVIPVRFVPLVKERPSPSPWE